MKTASACGLKLLVYEALSLAVFTLIQVLRDVKVVWPEQKLASGTTCFRELRMIIILYVRNCIESSIQLLNTYVRMQLLLFTTHVLVKVIHLWLSVCIAFDFSTKFYKFQDLLACRPDCRSRARKTLSLTNSRCSFNAVTRSLRPKFLSKCRVACYNIDNHAEQRVT